MKRITQVTMLVASAWFSQPLISAEYTELCAGISFRETPYTDMNCARKLSPDAAKGTKHFKLDKLHTLSISLL